MTPLETQLLDALKLRRATSWPFVAPPYGLGLTADTMGGMAEHTARNAAADKAVDEAIAAAEGDGVALAARVTADGQKNLRAMINGVARVGMPVLDGTTDGPVLGTVRRQSGRMVEIDLSAAGVALMEDMERTRPLSIGFDASGTDARVATEQVYFLLDNEAMPRHFGALATMTYPPGAPTCQARAESDFKAAGYVVTHRNVKHESVARRLKHYRGRWPMCIDLVPCAPVAAVTK